MKQSYSSQPGVIFAALPRDMGGGGSTATSIYLVETRMVLNILQDSSPQQRIILPQMSTVPRLRNRTR